MAVSLAVDPAGVLLISSTLVIPATIAFLSVDSFVPALLIAWGTGTLAIVGGLLSSFYWAVTPGPLLVVSFGVLLVLAWVLWGIIGVRPPPEPSDAGATEGTEPAAVSLGTPGERV